jgi:hypothetical protein
MLRRLLLIVVLVAFSGGFTAPEYMPIAMGMDCEQAALQAPSDCHSDGMAAGACALACQASPCIAPTLERAVGAVSAAQPLVSPAAPRPERARAPETAPPKHYLV